MDCCEVPRPELDDNNDGIGRTTGALCGERERERERKLKGDRERVQGGAFVLRCASIGEPVALTEAADTILRLILEMERFSFPPSLSDSHPCEGMRCLVGHSCRGRLRHHRRAQRQTQLLPTSTYYRRPLHSVVQARLSMPDMRSIVFCSYSSHLNDCIGDMAKTRRIAIAAFH